MIFKAEHIHKSIGLKELFHDLSFKVEEGEKIAIIGRNGLGKTTLFRIISGKDSEYYGSIELRQGTRLILTEQEHFLNEDITALDYILESVPRFRELQQIIRDFEKNSDHDWESIQKYSDAVHDFTVNDYYDIEDRIVETLVAFQIDEERTLDSFSKLSGGEKRFVELVRVMFSQAELALIDEPTNHMDYIGKAKFIEWLQNYSRTLILITHDRDVLEQVHRILELKDKKLFSFPGNYSDYIKQNNLHTTTGMYSYETGLKNLEQAKKQMLEARTMKLKAKSNKGRIQAKRREERFEREYEKIQQELVKPSFWIDQESLEQVSEEVAEKYETYKEKNITVYGMQKGDTRESGKFLFSAEKITVGYAEALFAPVTLQILHGKRIQIKGRNGAGKSSLIKTIIKEIQTFRRQNDLENFGYSNIFIPDTQTKIFSGTIKISPKAVIGIYEQEVNAKYLSMTLSEAVGSLLSEHTMPVNSQSINSMLGAYLFNPATDAEILFSNLSGGQKARFQLIRMMINKPNILILDEPTNHLDLPSIEELENALLSFHGAILYISHDHYFVNKLGGETMLIQN